ncbi:MAG: energy-coupling factor transporter transmembrane protein EcfT [Streptosporangiales bacterium]|nr:energy-coupling factor transporter transmembrane protein EcfT [Streptosporangiales bacterium]
MTVLFAPVAAADAQLRRFNPVAKLVAALLPVSVLVLTTDPLTPAIMLAALVLVLPATGVRVWPFVRRTWFLLPAGLLVGATNVLFARVAGGAVLVDAGPLLVTTEGLWLALGVVLRVYAVALPGALVFTTTDVTALADALVQQLRLPWRFTLGALAAFRLLPLLVQDWQLTWLARRARGVEAGRNPVAAVRLFCGAVFTLLVCAVRRAVRLATALEARGFGSRPGRTYARTMRMRTRDWLLLAAVCAVLSAAVTTSVHTGTWQPLLG